MKRLDLGLKAVIKLRTLKNKSKSVPLSDFTTEKHRVERCGTWGGNEHELTNNNRVFLSYIFFIDHHHHHQPINFCWGTGIP
jgi:hypothetical protein